MNSCPQCGDPLCPDCKRCLKAGHQPDCPSADAARCRAWIASLDMRERAVGTPATLLELLMQEDPDERNI